jgi:hypothetical protein
MAKTGQSLKPSDSFLALSAEEKIMAEVIMVFDFSS